MKPIPLHNIGRIVTGKTPKTSNPEFFGSDIPFVTPSDMGYMRTIYETARSLTPAGMATVKNCLIPADAVMVSCIGSDMGKSHIAGRSVVTNQQINSVIVDRDNFEPLFIYYNLFARRKALREMAGGAAQPILNKTDFGKITVLCPSLCEQREIAAILGALDNKIEVNRKASATLEEMARALYRSWFVDFDPVHAKAEGRAPAHIDAPTAALFPDSFGEDGLPMGWRISVISQVCDQIKTSVKPMEHPDKKFWHFSLPAFDNGATPLLEEGIAIKSNKTFVPNDAILFSRLNPVIPRVWWARYDENLGIPASSTEFFVAKSRQPIETPWLYAMISSPEFRDHALARVTGTSNSHQRVSASSMSEIEVNEPPSDIINAFGSATERWFERIHSLKAESQTLAALRESLLPRLMSGELRVGAAQNIIEEAL